MVNTIIVGIILILFEMIISKYLKPMLPELKIVSKSLKKFLNFLLKSGFSIIFLTTMIILNITNDYSDNDNKIHYDILTYLLALYLLLKVVYVFWDIRLTRMEKIIKVKLKKAKRKS